VSESPDVVRGFTVNRVEVLVERERELAVVWGLLDRGGGVVMLEGGAGIGKTALLDACCKRAGVLGHRVLRGRGSELESDFPFGLVRQLFDRTVAAEGADLLTGPAAGAAPLLGGVAPSSVTADDATFAVMHGLYWVAANLTARGPVLVAVDDAHWADEASLRWLAYLAPRVEGLPLSLIAALRPLDPVSSGPGLLAVRGEAEIVRPAVLSVAAVAGVVRDVLSFEVSDEVCAAIHDACGGNPFYLHALVRAIQEDGRPLDSPDLTGLLAIGQEDVATRLVTRVVGFDPAALALAQALAVLGDGGEVRHAATIASLPMAQAERLAEGLVRLEVLASDEPTRFLHPVVREALEGSMRRHERERAHRHAARLLHRDGAPAGQIAAHLVGLRPAGDQWVLARLRDAAAAAMASGTPTSAASLLRRALVEPPAQDERVAVLREAAHAEASSGHEAACALLERALGLVSSPRERAEIALEVAETYAALFRWVDAVDLLDRALAELGDRDTALAARLEGELVVSGLHDARRAMRVGPVLERLASRGAELSGEPLTVAQGMVNLLTGRPADETARPLEAVLQRSSVAVENWDTRAALLWVLVAAERFGAVQVALEPMLEQVRRSGSARGLVAVYSTLGLLKLRLGALPEADAEARVALEVLQEGDFAPGIAFAATVLSDVAVEAGQLDEAQGLLDLLPQDGWPPGVGTVLIPAARGRLRLAQRRPAEALADFELSMALFASELWGMRTRETGYVHARSGAALALGRLGEMDRARELAEAELEDNRVFGTPRAIGVSLRAAGLARGGQDGLALLSESVRMLRNSSALLERAHSLTEFGAALRRAGERAAARGPLGEALDLAARSGATPLAARAREELSAAGARPRRVWRTGVEALTPGELRVARLALQGRTNREIAYELYVTLKTVEGHLARVYSKLGIAGRQELGRALEGKDQGVTL
jgi:DNA-binding CsgD family transcriptional regulator